MIRKEFDKRFDKNSTFVQETAHRPMETTRRVLLHYLRERGEIRRGAARISCEAVILRRSQSQVGGGDNWRLTWTRFVNQPCRLPFHIALPGALSLGNPSTH